MATPTVAAPAGYAGRAVGSLGSSQISWDVPGAPADPSATGNPQATAFFANRLGRLPFHGRGDSPACCGGWVWDVDERMESV